MKVAEVIKSITTKDKNRAMQLPVRELEQESKGHYVAFVDDGEQSYDVQLFIQAAKITALTCDCPNGETLCLHKVAVLLAMEDSKGGTKKKSTTTGVKTKKKKLTETEEVMLRVDKEAITGWLSEVFKKNKPLEQLFLLTFSTDETQYTTDQVREIMEQTIKSVAGRRKTLEGANVKKLMDLMNIALEPVNHYVTVSINKPITLDIFSTVIETMTDFQNRIRTYSKKIDLFYDEYIHWLALTINNVQVKSVWEEVIKNIVYKTFEHFVNKKIEGKTYYNFLVKEVYHSANKEQQKYIADELVVHILSMPVKRQLMDFEYVLFLKEVALDQDVYDKVQEFFSIDIYKN
ncbi:hypothetical protein [Myroides odoratimimus]|uniref:hypothetical protein n=1 Tax=Myroides odoratimimus TaxID=76832 RepID=UPI0025750183|nr:hypothetical protein [Myroides odoratimimus]MDM1453738.1 hypothetical protein [Myroides odoratimimus]MDM1477460.1 hypothetical protein [Myroides odoratimimus]MDM1489720.1 hypothetical protein [Myroides odoratimimus]